MLNGSPIMLCFQRDENNPYFYSSYKGTIKLISLALISESAASIKRISRLTKSSKILKVIINAIHDKKGENVVSLDLRKIPEAVSDFFIVCEAPSTVQVRAIADWVESEVKDECGEKPYKHEGMGAGQWALIDYVNVVVHVFLAETRKFYKLEEMWSDGVALEANDDSAIAPVKPKKSAKTTKQTSTK